MRHAWRFFLAAMVCATMGSIPAFGQDQPAVALPDGVKAVWDLSKAYHETTPARERICINGLWQWQPVKERSEQTPTGNWGYCKVPGPWATTWNRAEESQVNYPNPSWKSLNLKSVQMAWYQREIEIPKDWAGRRITVDAQYVNNSAAFYLDGKPAGEIKSRGGRVDLTPLAKPGQKQMLSVFVRSSSFRGLCGDVYLDGVPQAERIDDVKIDTSVRKWQITVNAAVASLNPEKQYTFRGELLDGGKVVKSIASQPFRAADVQNGRITFSNPWKPDKLWDANTPKNKYDLKLKLLDAAGKVLGRVPRRALRLPRVLARWPRFRLEREAVLLFRGPAGHRRGRAPMPPAMKAPGR